MTQSSQQSCDPDSRQGFRVSVVIPTWNNAWWIGRAVDSVLQQTLAAYEIIVVDDGSTDETGEVLARYRADERIRYIRQPNGGVSAARNRGIREATGQWVAFLDSDDYWLPEKLATQAAILQAGPDLRWCGGNYYQCDNDGPRGCFLTHAPDALRTLGEPSSSRSCCGGAGSETRGIIGFYFSLFAAGVWGHTDTMLIRRDLLLEAELFREGQLLSEDLDMWFRIACLAPEMGYAAEPLAVHHRDLGSLNVQQKPVAMYTELIGRHLALSKEYGAYAAFLPCARLLTRRTLRSFLFQRRYVDIRTMITELGTLLPGWYRAAMTILAAMPPMARAVCATASWTARHLKLRQKGRRMAGPDPPLHESPATDTIDHHDK